MFVPNAFCLFLNVIFMYFRRLIEPMSDHTSGKGACMRINSWWCWTRKIPRTRTTKRMTWRRRRRWQDISTGGRRGCGLGGRTRSTLHRMRRKSALEEKPTRKSRGVDARRPVTPSWSISSRNSTKCARTWTNINCKLNEIIQEEPLPYFEENIYINGELTPLSSRVFSMKISRIAKTFGRTPLNVHKRRKKESIEES